MGIHEPHPRLSCWLPDGAKRQTAYQIRTDNAWDTGRVEDAASVLVTYDGPALLSHKRVRWEVRVWTDLRPSDWSQAATFETGPLDPSEWVATWIEPVGDDVPAPGSRPVIAFRGNVDLRSGPPVRARLSVMAHGIYEAFVNGTRVGRDELIPGFTQYRTRLQVQTHDVAALLRSGRNVLGALVSDGWFRARSA